MADEQRPTGEQVYRPVPDGWGKYGPQQVVDEWDFHERQRNSQRKVFAGVTRGLGGVDPPPTK
jgi:hypothetical protein